MLKDKLHGNHRVFLLSSAIIFAFSLLGASMPDHLGNFFSTVQGWLTERFGWLYVLAMSGFLVMAFVILFSRFGDIRLGPDDSRPEFSRASWFAMLFSAGMGIGLLFYGIAEPIMHFESPAPPVNRGGSLDAARNAMGVTIFHWGLHPWACYALVGLSLAYFGYRKGLPLTIRSAFYPIMGERIHQWPGHLIDVLAIVSTLFGVATSLGLGVMQVNAGLSHVFNLPFGTIVQVVLIVLITAAAVASVVSGIDKGVKSLSEINMSAAGLLMLFVFIAGPTAFLLNSLAENVGIYLQTLPVNSFWTAALESDRRDWLGNWTVFYWAWWIAWSPFVGMFIARISRGRTIREFTLAVLVAPTVMSVIWFTIMGNSAIYMELFGNGGIGEAVSDNVATSLFVFLEQYPATSVTSLVGVTCVALFFVTSSDSASLVIDTIASGGMEDPPIWQRVYWAVLEGVVAMVLLLAGGLKALQTGAITTALPFTFVVIVMTIGLMRSLHQEPRRPHH
jgi:choline/glycine/proline betaine transport protein